MYAYVVHYRKESKFKVCQYAHSKLQKRRTPTITQLTLKDATITCVVEDAHPHYNKEVEFESNE